MSDTPAEGALAKLGIHTADPVTQAFEFLSCSLRKTESHVNSQGIRGTRSRRSHRTRIASSYCNGSIVMNPSVTEIDLLLPWAIGSTSGAVTSVAETLAERYITVDKISKVFTYAGCVVSRLTITGNEGQPLVWTFDIEAETETEGNAGTFPSITIPTDNMFIMNDCTLTLVSAARKFRTFTLVIDNLLDTTRQLNALTRTEIPAQDRQVSLDVSSPYTTDNTALYNAAVAGAAGSLVVTDGTTTYTFAFGNCKIPAVGQEISGKTEIFMPLRVDCYHDGTNAEIKVTKS